LLPLGYDKPQKGKAWDSHESFALPLQLLLKKSLILETHFDIGREKRKGSPKRITRVV